MFPDRFRDFKYLLLFNKLLVQSRSSAVNLWLAIDNSQNYLLSIIAASMASIVSILIRLLFRFNDRKLELVTSLKNCLLYLSPILLSLKSRYSNVRQSYNSNKRKPYIVSPSLFLDKFKNLRLELLPKACENKIK